MGVRRSFSSRDTGMGNGFEHIVSSTHLMTDDIEEIPGIIPIRFNVVHLENGTDMVGQINRFEIQTVDMMLADLKAFGDHGKHMGFGA